jgi:hypothetical protein
MNPPPMTGAESAHRALSVFDLENFSDYKRKFLEANYFSGKHGAKNLNLFKLFWKMPG